MTEWSVVGVLVTVAGLFITVGTPVFRLSSAITELQTTLREFRRYFEEETQRNAQSHRELVQTQNLQLARLEGCEIRLTKLEEKSE